MTTTNDNPTQDPTDPFARYTAEVHRTRDAHGAASPVLLLVCVLFTRMLKLLATLAEQVRTGQLPATAPARTEAASPAPRSAPAPSRAPAPACPPRHSFRPWRWMLGAEMSGMRNCARRCSSRTSRPWLSRRNQTRCRLSRAGQPNLGRQPSPSRHDGLLSKNRSKHPRLRPPARFMRTTALACQDAQN